MWKSLSPLHSTSFHKNISFGLQDKTETDNWMPWRLINLLLYHGNPKAEKSKRYIQGWTCAKEIITKDNIHLARGYNQEGITKYYYLCSLQEAHCYNTRGLSWAWVFMPHVITIVYFLKARIIINSMLWWVFATWSFIKSFWRKI